MEISENKSGEFFVLRLAGRLDASWCGPVQGALAGAIRGGEHRLRLDMAEVSYISSAGLRVLLTSYKQLCAINGSFEVVRPSAAVRSVLELAGLELLLGADEPAADAGVAATAPILGRHASPSAEYELFPVPGGGPSRVGIVGDAEAWRAGKATGGAWRCTAGSLVIGVGALGADEAEAGARAGEFLAVAGVAAFQPPEASSRPDFLVSQVALIPEARLLTGLAGEVAFSRLARFEAKAEARSVSLAELAGTALQLAGTPAVAIALLAESNGLVGASLRRSAGVAPGAPRLGFPEVRDWISFSGERVYRDSTTLIVGVVARPGTVLDPLLRPHGGDATVRAHLHAAVFSYRPLRKGRIELAPSVAELFEGQGLQAVLHLLADTRGFHGAGDSEFQRGALWLAPFQP